MTCGMLGNYSNTIMDVRMSGYVYIYICIQEGGRERDVCVYKCFTVYVYKCRLFVL